MRRLRREDFLLFIVGGTKIAPSIASPKRVIMRLFPRGGIVVVV
jgi:hypothetical protein